MSATTDELGGLLPLPEFRAYLAGREAAWAEAYAAGRESVFREIEADCAAAVRAVAADLGSRGYRVKNPYARSGSDAELRAFAAGLQQGDRERFRRGLGKARWSA